MPDTVPPSADAQSHFQQGLIYLRRGEAILPPAMTARKNGGDVFSALLGLAAVATARALGQTRWIEEYRAEMRQALAQFEQAGRLAPAWADAQFRRAQVLRYLGETTQAKDAAQIAARLDPARDEYAALVRALEEADAPPVNLPRRSSSYRIERGGNTQAIEDLTWDDVVLPAKTKRELRQMQLVLEKPEQARALGVAPPSGLLLYGPPGTGKTTVARILAAQAKCRFLAASPAQINHMWMGESEKAVARLFADARAQAPAIVFLDEIDALIPVRSGGLHQYSDKVVNQFLHEMDGLKPMQGVFVVGATNRPDMLDPALVRGGRLSRLIEIPLPDSDARLSLLKLHTQGATLDPSVNLEWLSVQTEGMSGADLKALINDAGLQALIRLTDDGGTNALTPDDFQIALENLQPETL